MILLKKLLVTLLISLTSVNSYCQVSSPDVVFLNKGSVTAFDGYLFPPAKAILMKKELLELDELRALAASYQKTIDDYAKNEDLENYKVNTLLEQNDKLSDALYKKEDRSKYENWFWFGIGIVVTGLAVYGAGRLK